MSPDDIIVGGWSLTQHSLLDGSRLLTSTRRWQGLHLCLAAFLCLSVGCQSDVECFFDEQCGVVCRLIQHLGLVPKLGGGSSRLALLWPTSPSHPFWYSCLVLFDAGLKSSLRLTYVYTATATWDLAYDVGLLLLWISIFHLHGSFLSSSCSMVKVMVHTCIFPAIDYI